MYSEQSLSDKVAKICDQIMSINYSIGAVRLDQPSRVLTADKRS